MNKNLKTKELSILLFCAVAVLLFFGCQTALIVEETASKTELSKAELLYNYGVRNYEMEYGIFSAIDPQAERYTSVSPYAYVLNNPIQIDSLTKVLLFPAENVNKE